MKNLVLPSILCLFLVETSECLGYGAKARTYISTQKPKADIFGYGDDFFNEMMGSDIAGLADVYIKSLQKVITQQVENTGKASLII